MRSVGWVRGSALWVALAGPVFVMGDEGGTWWVPAGGLAAFLPAAVPALVVTASLFTYAYGAALAVFALVLGVRAEGEGPALRAFGTVAAVGTVGVVVRDADPAAG